jgi:hypothetical protein
MAGEIESMVAEMRRAQDLVQEDRAGEALGVYRELLAEARKAGLDLAYLHYAIAVAQDCAGDLEARSRRSPWPSARTRSACRSAIRST